MFTLTNYWQTGAINSVDFIRTGKRNKISGNSLDDGKSIFAVRFILPRKLFNNSSLLKICKQNSQLSNFYTIEISKFLEFYFISLCSGFGYPWPAFGFLFSKNICKNQRKRCFWWSKIQNWTLFFSWPLFNFFLLLILAYAILL